MVELMITIVSRWLGLYGIRVLVYLRHTLTFFFFSFFLQLCGAIILSVAISIRAGKIGQEVNKYVIPLTK